MTDPIETRGATGATGAKLSNQEVIRPHRAGAAWGHRGHEAGPAPLAPPGPTGLGPRNPLKDNAGPTGPTGPTANDMPDVVRAVLAAFEPADDPRTRLDAARARVARLADPDGVARSPEGIEAVWDEAEALAAVLAEAADAAGITPADLTAAIQDDDHD